MCDINDINDVNIFKNDFANDIVNTQHSRINRIKLLWGYLQFCKRLVNDFVNKPPKFGEIGQMKNVFKNHNAKSPPLRPWQRTLNLTRNTNTNKNRPLPVVMVVISLHVRVVFANDFKFKLIENKSETLFVWQRTLKLTDNAMNTNKPLPSGGGGAP